MFVSFKIMEDFKISYNEWVSLPEEVKLMYVYYEQIKALKQKHEIEQSKQNSAI